MYGKLFVSMFSGSLYGHWQAIVTFQQMIILADKDGTLEMTPRAIAATTSIPLDIIEAGILVLEATDKNSRTPDEDGRRIIRINPERPWGWHITNYAYYRAIRTAEDRREYHKKYWHLRKQKAQPDSTGAQPNQPIVEVKVKVKAEAEKSLVPQTGRQDAEQIIFDHWKQNLNHPKAVLDGKRKACIKRALITYSAADCCLAIDGCSKTPHNMGQNDRGERYDDITLILRDATHIERFMRNASKPPTPRAPSKTAQALQALEGKKR